MEYTYERRRAIEYGSDGNKVVRHWHNVRPVSDTIFLGEPEKDECGREYAETFVFFPGVPDGMMITGFLLSVDYIVKNTKSLGLDSVQNFVASLHKRQEQNAHIGYAMIEFARQWDAQAASSFAAYRDAWNVQREEEERRRRAEKEAEKAAEQAKKDAEDKAVRALYLGYADKMTPHGFVKMHAHMDGLIRHEGKVMSHREFIMRLVREGWLPKKEENVTSWYGSRWEPKESKPRTEYRLCRGDYSYKVSKTEFSFAEYISEHPDVLEERVA